MLYTEFVVPGISMTTPSHHDVYRYSDMLDTFPFSQLYRAPRPVGWLALKLGGALPWPAMMWTFSLVGIVASMAPVVVYSLLRKRTIPIAGMVLWSVLMVSYPATYLGLVHDLGSRLALLFASIGVYWYAIYFQQKSSYHLSIACLFSLAGFLSKETFGPMQIATVAYIGYLYRAKPREIAGATLTVILALAASLLHSRLIGSPFTSGEASYAIDFNLFHVVRAAAGFAALALTPQILLCLAGLVAFLAWRRDWSGVSMCAAGAAISLLSLLPNSMLTKHGGCNYEMILVPLLAGLVVALADYWGLFTQLKAALPLALCGLAISGVAWGEYELKKYYSWQMGIARFNQKVIDSLHLFKEELRTADKVAVVGLQQNHVVQPWTPFTDSPYLRDNLAFPATTFTIVSPGYANMPEVAKRGDRTRVYVPDLETARNRGVNLVLAFGDDGTVRHIITNRGQIDRLMAAKGLDPTQLYDPKYWASAVEPLLLEPDSVTQAEIKSQPGDREIQGIASFFKGLPSSTCAIGVENTDGDGPSQLRRWLPVRYDSVLEYGRKNPDVFTSPESLQKHLITTEDVAYVIAPMTTNTTLGTMVRSALEKAAAMGLADVCYHDEYFQAWALLKKQVETISLQGGGTASIVYDAKELCKKPSNGVITIFWDNSTGEAAGAVSIDVKATEGKAPTLWMNGRPSGTATTGPWVPIGGEIIFRKIGASEVLGRVKVMPDCAESK